MAHPLQDFAGEVSEHDWPTVVCPRCKSGTFPYSSVTMVEDPESASWHDHESWDPDMIFGTFHGSSPCTNSACGQYVIMTGSYGFVINEGDPEYGQYGELYRLKSFDPALPLLDSRRASRTK
jgi:hypothetical protein